MRVISWGELKKTPFTKPSAVSCGVFDGVHRGHRALINAVKSRSDLQSVIVTFSEHPRCVLFPERRTEEIITLEKKIELLSALEVETLVLVDFSNEFRLLEGAVFIETLFKNACMRLFVIGRDFKCGHGGSFKAEQIVNFCSKLGIETNIVPPVLDGGAPVSSSRIRAALGAGDNETAKRLLGYSPFFKNFAFF
ncbi:MAG: FAD synthetase family protein [Spirochaetaceae bacterium]|jgi:riboflavin kinase/FMN adenylyltransferase|nr:FAD synthetase family protein [Spirochaetaceae bacterium]GMO28615.1 MAG: hypothetical protein Pg6A_16600 [Termitinemataceae bacterium]